MSSIMPSFFGRRQQIYRLVLVGRTGNGISATGNHILGNIQFESKQSLNSVTQDNSSRETDLPDGTKITVVDTPGLFNTRKSLIRCALQIRNSLTYASPGPHAFLIVLKHGPFTEEEEKTVEILSIVFGPRFFNHAIIVFTHTDLSQDDKTMLAECKTNDGMKSLFDKCDGRIFTVNNGETDTIKNHEKRTKLLQMVKSLSNNCSRCYDDKSLLSIVTLERHVKEWIDTRLDLSKIQQLLQEQRVEFDKMERTHEVQLHKLEREKKEESKRLKQKAKEEIKLKKEEEKLREIKDMKKRQKLVRKIEKKMNEKIERLTRDRNEKDEEIKKIKREQQEQLRKMGTEMRDENDTLKRKLMEEIQTLQETVQKMSDILGWNNN